MSNIDWEGQPQFTKQFYSRDSRCEVEKTLAILVQCKHFGQTGAIPLVELHVALYKQFMMYTYTCFMLKKRNT